MKHISVGEKFSLLIDEHGHLYTWGLDNLKGQLGRNSQEDDTMPQIVDHLEQKYVTYAICGRDFGLALGQNFDCEGNIVGDTEIEFNGNLERASDHGQIAGDISKISNIH